MSTLSDSAWDECAAQGGAAVPAVGDSVVLGIESVGYRGIGIARAGKMVVQVPGTIPGERVRVRITRRHRRYLEGRRLDVLDPSPYRLDPPEHVLPGNPPGAMAGCVYGHMDYREECRLKREQLASFLERSGVFREEDIAPLVPSPRRLNYRNKIVLHVGTSAEAGSLGYIGEDNRTVVDLEQCALALPPLNDLLRRIRAGKEFPRRLQHHRHLILRYTEADGALAWWDRPGKNDPALQERSPTGLLTVPRSSFFQVNPPVAEAVSARVQGWIEKEKPQRLLDLYCGVGVFALMAVGQGVREVIGCDVHRESIRAARGNARRLGLPARFECRAAVDVLRDLHGETAKRDQTCLVLDPPRRGLTPAVLEAVCEKKPGAVIYVSCAPDTLVRDLVFLCKHGYRIREVAPFDMFPRTASFETAVLLHYENDSGESVPCLSPLHGE